MTRRSPSFSLCFTSLQFFNFARSLVFSSRCSLTSSSSCLPESVSRSVSIFDRSRSISSRSAFHCRSPSTPLLPLSIHRSTVDPSIHRLSSHRQSPLHFPCAIYVNYTSRCENCLTDPLCFSIPPHFIHLGIRMRTFLECGNYCVRLYSYRVLRVDLLICACLLSRPLYLS